jgi:hypothetical protein
MSSGTAEVPAIPNFDVAALGVSLLTVLVSAVVSPSRVKFDIVTFQYETSFVVSKRRKRITQ